MTEQATHDPVRMEIIWDNPDTEFRVLSGILAVLKRGEEEGLDPESLSRVTDYISARYPAPPF